MKAIADFISDLTKRVSSRKFLVLLLAVGLHISNGTAFSGDNLVWVFAIFIGADVLQKFVEARK